MHLTGVLNPSIGSTGIKKNRGALMSFMSLAHTAGLSSSFGFPTSRRRRSLRARARRSMPPLLLVRTAAVRPRHRRTPCHLCAPPPSTPKLARHPRLHAHPHRVQRSRSQYGSREEEREGGRGREVRSQEDPRRGGREGRVGGQGRRGAGLGACSFIPDQGAAQQRQSWQGHQGHGTAGRERFI